MIYSVSRPYGAGKNTVAQLIASVETFIRCVQLRTLMGCHHTPDADIKERYSRSLLQLNTIFKKLIENEPLTIPIHEIRLPDYTKDQEIENIADNENNKVTFLTLNKKLLAKWQILLPEMFR